jgi:hypothetical protein
MNWLWQVCEIPWWPATQLPRERCSGYSALLLHQVQHWLRELLKQISWIKSKEKYFIHVMYSTRTYPSWCCSWPGRRYVSIRVMTRAAMCDCSDDCRLYTISNITTTSSSCNCQNFAAEQLLSGQAVRTIHHSTHMPGHSPPAKLGRTPWWADSLWLSASMVAA